MPSFQIEVEFDPSWPVARRSVVNQAVQRWLQVITGPLPPVLVGGRRIDGLLISASMVNLGPSGMLGASRPVELRPASAGTAAYLPATAVLELDGTDFDVLQQTGALTSVLAHEIGHALGIGFVWPYHGLINGAGTRDPTFVGRAAMREYGTLLETGPAPVPVENSGRDGNADLHWRKSKFGVELMTSSADGAHNPLSRVTVGSLEDLGYVVDYAAADPFALPRQNVFMGMLRAIVGPRRHLHEGRPPMPVVLPDDALMRD